MLSASAACFAEKGFPKCSMQDIADGAGMSKGAVYSHFESKEVVFRIMITLEHELGAQKSLEASKSPSYLDSIINLLVCCISVPAFPRISDAFQALILSAAASLASRLWPLPH